MVVQVNYHTFTALSGPQQAHLVTCPLPKPPPMAMEPMETCQDPPRDRRKQVRATLCGGPYMPQAPMDTCRAPSPKATTYLPGSGLLRSTPRRHGDEGIAGGRKALLLSLHAV